MKIVIIKYNAGNVLSVQLALKRLGYRAEITDDLQAISRADRVIFPGVGQASAAMAYLKLKGLDSLLAKLTQPVLGICLGLQLLCRHSQEEETEAIGVYRAEVKRFPPVGKVPHMGWNSVSGLQGTLFNEIPENSYFYFVHSYYVPLAAETTARCSYLLPFSAAMQKDNFFGVQFHPEKSADVGAQLLRNFIELE